MQFMRRIGCLTQLRKLQLDHVSENGVLEAAVSNLKNLTRLSFGKTSACTGMSVRVSVRVVSCDFQLLFQLHTTFQGVKWVVAFSIPICTRTTNINF